jgi:metal-dependent amidase/aminoacylase/carboxypeptidase family protein
MQAPATVNDVKSAEILKTAFKEYFGENAIDSDPFGASEDFSILATSCGAPYVFYMYGCVDPNVWDKAEKAGKINEIPHNHSAFFAPEIQPTMKTAVDAFALAAMTFLDNPSNS